MHTNGSNLMVNLRLTERQNCFPKGVCKEGSNSRLLVFQQPPVGFHPATRATKDPNQTFREGSMRQGNKRAAALAASEEARALRAEHKQEALELVAHIRRNMQFITDAFFEIGVALTALNNNRLYSALGYSTFADALANLKLMSQSQANKLIAVAQLVPREAAVQLGSEKSYALTRYVQVAPEAQTVQQLLHAGRLNGKPLTEISVQELEDTTRRLASRRPRRPGSAAARAATVARQAQALLRKRGWDGVRVTPVARGTRVRLEMDVDVLERVTRG
jgi:hypothetical protein